ncbi:MAG: PHP domain-containing protein [marine benthic group bacterium]|nr:PHP domain-containing protein [Gemmatimonadota bacterium]MCL7980064.1 PHP domain-containing protein [Gemmatimonadota bacterium]
MTDWTSVDLHAHTSWSADARTSPAELVERAEEEGIGRIAVTDHGEIEGALVARSIDPSRVIVGEEIRCAGRTELIGLFLSERIPQGLSVQETADRIRDQGGIVYAPHPWAYAYRPARHAARSIAVADIVEVFNSRAFWQRWNRRAAESAGSEGRVMAASSDAHFPHEIGRARTALPAFEGPQGLLEALSVGQPMALTVGSPFVHVASVLIAARRRLTLLPTDQAGWDTVSARRGGPAIG